MEAELSAEWKSLSPVLDILVCPQSTEVSFFDEWGLGCWETLWAITGKVLEQTLIEIERVWRNWFIQFCKNQIRYEGWSARETVLIPKPNNRTQVTLKGFETEFDWTEAILLSWRQFTQTVVSDYSSWWRSVSQDLDHVISNYIVRKQRLKG